MSLSISWTSGSNVTLGSIIPEVECDHQETPQTQFPWPLLVVTCTCGVLCILYLVVAMIKLLISRHIQSTSATPLHPTIRGGHVKAAQAIGDDALEVVSEPETTPPQAAFVLSTEGEPAEEHGVISDAASLLQTIITTLLATAFRVTVGVPVPRDSCSSLV
ncbi:hypothetical protein BC628DRAFT_1380999 [Trametes gibbosa]|nr:hypothetical protein BC628DRAFT_1380999 [Trametes gibbosa]